MNVFKYCYGERSSRNGLKFVNPLYLTLTEIEKAFSFMNWTCQYFSPFANSGFHQKAMKIKEGANKLKI